MNLWTYECHVKNDGRDPEKIMVLHLGVFFMSREDVVLDLHFVGNFSSTVFTKKRNKEGISQGFQESLSGYLIRWSDGIVIW